MPAAQAGNAQPAGLRVRASRIPRPRVANSVATGQVDAAGALCRSVSPCVDLQSEKSAVWSPVRKPGPAPSMTRHPGAGRGPRPARFGPQRHWVPARAGMTHLFGATRSWEKSLLLSPGEVARFQSRILSEFRDGRRTRCAGRLPVIVVTTRPHRTAARDGNGPGPALPRSFDTPSCRLLQRDSQDVFRRGIRAPECAGSPDPLAAPA